MRTIALIIICLSAQLHSLAKDGLAGTYYNESGMCLKVEKDTLYFIIPQTPPVIFSNDTLLKCAIKIIDDHFIELNSPLPQITALSTQKVDQSFDPNIHDGIKVCFIIPYKRSDLQIEVFTDKFKTFKFKYSTNNKEITIPKDTQTIFFSITPEYLIPNMSNGLFSGLIKYEPMAEYNIEENVNTISIELPAVDDSFFEKLYCNGDYARVIGNTIIWHGDVFVKKP